MKQLQFLQHSTLFPLLIYICFLINGYDKIMSVLYDASFLYHQPFDEFRYLIKHVKELFFSGASSRGIVTV